MRKPRIPSSRRDCFAAVLVRKDIDHSAVDVLMRAAKPKGFMIGSSGDGWHLTFRLRREVLLVSLSADGSAPFVGLDHHEVPGEIDIGYHWDLYPPLVDIKRRCSARPEPGSAEDALRFICLVWNIGMVGSTEGLFDARR